MLKYGMADGAIMFDIMKGDPRTAYLRQKKIPFVIIGKDLDYYDTSYVDLDNRYAGFLGAQYLVSKGRRRIVFMVGNEEFNNNPERVAGFLDFFNTPEAVEKKAVGQAITGVHSIRVAYEKSKMLLTAPAGERPDAIFVSGVTGFLAGANDYVKKPADAWELKARVRSLLQLKTSFEERLRMESAWLQSQIRPHFLYNTLNSIAALAAIDIEKMLTLLYEFSNYLRLSFDFKNASPLVDLEHELSLVRSYIYIEQERFGDRIKVEWEVDEGISIRVPPLSIQPLVENAVKHGLMSRSRGGTVSIVIRRQEGLRGFSCWTQAMIS